MSDEKAKELIRQLERIDDKLGWLVWAVIMGFVNLILHLYITG